VTKTLLVLVLLFVLSLFLSWLLLGRLWVMPKAVAVAQLEKLLPRLGQAQLTAYRNQSWCRNIAYGDGNFSETNSPSTCNLFEGEARPFDEPGRTAFNDLRQSLLLTGVNINFLNVYIEEGKIRQAEFSLGCWLCSRTRYVYEPDYVLPEDRGSEMWFDGINKDWYEVNEDWN
jgi:hypothetical protein